ncbi:multicopper oxidase [Oidiodendron maius Zn]|uniref:Multicopper oxidase n=1 Tax=Oidiodendron maius (strain Zn) TaxID=913774 RepID=A0A0C3H6M0_OIDMZ|nr:multicopper oxidase [Oidiodendron maius Zn]
MSPYEDASPVKAESVEAVEMAERDDSHDQEQRLLGGDVENTGDVEYRVEWHLRTGWAVAGSIFSAALVFCALIIFTKLFIVNGPASEDVEAASERVTFRRPAADYILDKSWDFNAPSRVREYNWTIIDIVANPDGVFRPLLSIDGQFPGPLIECNEGDTLVIEVDNQSVNATSLHFHGIFQNGTNFMDGTAGITQCPIAPKQKFRYEFTIKGQSGTYYYHGHQAAQLVDGLYGPIVVHSKDEKKLQQINYVTDRVVMLQDYYHDISSGLLIESLEPGSESSPIPNGALLNGLNRRDCSKLAHRMCDNSTATLPTFDLTPNANHRLRFINTGAFAWFQVSMDDHKLTITEADGTDIVPVDETSLMISPAQRYSVVITADQKHTDSFWLRARMVSHCWKQPNKPGPGADVVKAIIRYASPHKRSSKSMAEPTTQATNRDFAVQCKDMNTTSYVPASFEPPPLIADHSYYIRSNLEIGDWRLERGFFNKSTFRPNLQQPTLHRTIEGLAKRNESFTSMLNKDGVNSVAYNLKNDFVIQHSGIKVVDLVIENFDEGNHPMHLHGHKFWILGQGHGAFPGYQAFGFKSEGKGILDGHQTQVDNLMRRDVATVEGFGWLVLRFVADNPGIWALHCHMAWHSEAGLVMQFLSRVDEVAKWEIPAANRQLCEANLEELEKGATPKDSIWFGFGVG